MDPASGRVDARQAQGVQVGDHNHQEINDQRQFHLYGVTGRAARQLTAPAGRDPSWSPPAVVGRIPPRPRRFRDRGIFAGLVEALGDERGGCPPVVLSGLGGAGKTQLAAAYARFRRDGPEPVLIVWIDASSPDAIVSRYAQAGAQVVAEERLGRSDRRTLGIRGKIVQWSGQAGAPTSIMEAGELLTDRTRILGALDSDTLTARHTLACLHLQRGEPAAAAAELRSLLADRIRLLGADHAHSVTTRHNLALSLADLGDVTEAIEEFDRVFVDSVRLLGPNHPDTLSTRHDLLRLRAQTGELDNPVAAFQELVGDRARVLGPDHPDTLATRSELAAAVDTAGDHAAALDAFDVLLQDRQRVLGPDHPDTLLSRLCHLACGWHHGAIPDAEALVEQVAVDAARVLGTDHRHVQMAHALGATIRVADAEKAAASCRDTHGADHVQTLQARSRLVSARFEAQDLHSAAREAEQLMADLDRVLGPYDTNTLATRSVLAVIRGVAGDPAGAVSQLENLLGDMEREFNPDSDEILVVRHQLDAFRAFAADSP